MNDAIDNSVITHYDYSEYLDGRYTKNLISAIKAGLKELNESEVKELIDSGFELIEDVKIENNYKEYSILFNTEDENLGARVQRICPKILLY